ncbi:MAG: hypothetical protein AB7H92_17655 [Microbacteriaceae bacterium]
MSSQTALQRETTRYNNRGQPVTSIGQRNAAAIGTNHGNGGVTPPGHYRRRRNNLTVSPDGKEHRNGKMARERLLRLNRKLRAAGVITRTEFDAVESLADISDGWLSRRVPAHATIGRGFGVSASTVCRALNSYREKVVVRNGDGLVIFRVLEWEHVMIFDPELRRRRGTSNTYEFRVDGTFSEHFKALEREWGLGGGQSKRERSQRTPTRAEAEAARIAERSPTERTMSTWQRAMDGAAERFAQNEEYRTFTEAQNAMNDALRDEPADYRAYAQQRLGIAWVLHERQLE